MTESAETRLIEPLTVKHRQAMIEALYRRYINACDASVLEPSRLARAAVMSDEDLLNTLVVYESDGDTEIAQALARLGFSEVPVEVELTALRGGASVAGADAVCVEVSVSQLRCFEIDHFTVRDLADFGSLRLDLPRASFCVGYSSGMDVADAGDLLKGSAVLTNGPSGEPMIAFEVERAIRNQLDVVYRTAPVPLAQLREQVAKAVGEGDMLKLAEGVENALWVYAPRVEEQLEQRVPREA
jgi:hypothetical protein